MSKQMHVPADPSRSQPLRRVAVLGLVFVAALLSCGKDVTGPLGGAARWARGIAFEAMFPPAFQAAGGSASGIVSFDRVHVVLHHNDGTVALDTVIEFPAGADSVTLDLSVRLLPSAPAAGEPMTLNLGYINAAGDTVFRGGPVAVTAAPPATPGVPNPPVQVPVSYTGPGAAATQVVISPRSTTVSAGAGFSFTAAAKDANGQVLANTPVIWNSLDPAIATLTSAAAGSGLAQNLRGSARIVAQLLTGPADTVLVNVVLPASQIIAQSGNAQTGTVGTTLANPLVVKVAASDGVGVGGVAVTFAVASGGGSLTSTSVVSDAGGLAQTSWRLGTGTGTQSVTATAGALANSPLTFTATAQAAAASKLVITSQPGNALAGAALAPLVVTAEDANGNVATSFTGPVTVALGTNAAGATLGGTTTVNAVAGVATFANLTVNKNASAYTLVVSSSGLTGATTGTFDIAVGAPAKLVFTGQPSDAVANVAITPAIVVNAEDSQGNPTPAFTGAVTLGIALNPGSAALGGTVTVNAVAGIATFAGVTVSAAGSPYALSASATGLTAATSQTFSIAAPVPAGASQLVFTQQPTNAIAGVALSPAITVAAKDANNLVVTSYTGPVTLALASNPGAATLGGTATANAVAGVATFNTISITKAATGYTLSAASGALTSATSTAFNIAAAAAANIASNAGNAQSGLVSTLLATPLAVKVTDAFGNPVTGATVNWAVATGGGSVGAASSLTNALGIATTSWTLGALAGTQTVTATALGLAGSPVTFSATASVTSANRTWTGATSTAWTTATNWSPAVVPVATDSVLIPVTANNPQISATTTVADLYVAAGATLTLTSSAVTLGVNGTLDATGDILGTGNVALTPTGTRSLRGTINAGTVTLFGAYALNGSLGVAANLVVNSGGSLVLNGFVASALAGFSTAGTGTLNMTHAGDILAVTGNASFGGGAETGLLTTGILTVTGNFTQSNTSNSFDASGTHTVQMIGSVASTVAIASPNSSRFQNITFSNTAGTTLLSNVLAQGNVTIGGTVNGAANGFTIGGTLTDPGAKLTVSAISFMTSTAPVAATTPTINSNVTFNNNPSILAGNVAINGAVFVLGNLQLAGHQLVVSGTFATQGAGQLTMTNAADSMFVAGNATFDGGVEAGILTAGKLVLNGNFAQANTGGNAQQFKAVAGHLTVLTGSAAQTVSFVTPDISFGVGCSQSCFGDLTINKSGGTVTYLTSADHEGKLRVLTGVTSVSSTSFLAVHDSTITPASTPVTLTRFGTAGNLALDPSATIIDTIGFYGTSAQVIPAGTYNETIIKGTPTVGAGGFTTTAGLTVDGGTLTLGGQSVSVDSAFATANNGTLVMTNALDSLFVQGAATFAGGPEAGKLTNGTLLLFQGLAVSAAGQFSASGNHVTYLVGPHPILGAAELPTNGRNAVLGGAALRRAPGARNQKAALAAMRAQVAAEAKNARATSAKLLAARQAMAAQWPSRADAARAAAAAGAAVNAAHGTAGPRMSSPQAAGQPGRSDVRFNLARGPQRAARSLSASIAIGPHSLTPVSVAFTDTTGNQFANLRVVGIAQVSTFARAAGKVKVDTSGVIQGTGHLAIGDSLVGALNSTVQVEAVELFGGLGDAGLFSPDTTIFSGTSQMMPSSAGPGSGTYNNVVVNSPSLNVTAEDGFEIDVLGSLIVQNSGQLRVGTPDTTCFGCMSDFMVVDGSLETHGSGTLKMIDDNTALISVFGNALFAGGSTSNMLTFGEIDLYGNFAQSGSATAFAATAPHETQILDAAVPGNTVSFANPSFAGSHFGELYLADTLTVLQSDVFASGELGTGTVPMHHVRAGTAGFTITSTGADVRDVLFDGTLWSLVEGDSVTFMDAVTFANEPPTAIQFSVNRTGAGSFATMTNWAFLTTPTGAGRYISATDADGVAPFVTLIMSLTTPATSGGLVTLGNGAILNGWSSTSNSEVWTNAVGGSWSSAANWSLGRVPVSSDSVFITLAGTYTVTLDTTFTASQYVVVGGASGTQTLSLSGRTLTVNGPMYVGSHGSFLPTNSTVSGTATLTDSGNVTLSNTTVNVPVLDQGTLIASGTSGIAGALTTTAGSTLAVGQVDGSISTATLTVANGFTNNGAIQLSVFFNAAYGSQLTVASGTLTNAAGATIAALPGTAAGGSRTLSANLNNQGTISAAASAPLTINLTGASTNTGTIDASLANISLLQGGATPSFSNGGTFTVGAGDTLTFNANGGSFTHAVGAVLSGAGRVALNNITGGALNAGFTVGSFSLGASAVSLGTPIVTTGPWTITGGSSITGTSALTNAVGQTMTLNGSNVSAAFVNQGTLIASGSSSLTGAVTTAPGSTINVGQVDGAISKATLTVQNGFTNNGTIALTDLFAAAYSSQLVVTSGSLTNAAGATISALGGTAPGGSRTIGASTVDNFGTISLYPGGAGAFNIIGNLTLEPTSALNINIGGTAAGSQYGQLIVSQGVTLGGTVNVALINAFTPTTGNAFSLITSGSAMTATFATTSLPGTMTPLYSALSFQVQQP